MYPPETKQRLHQAWSTQLELHPDELRVLYAAASYYELASDKPQAALLWRRAVQIAPTDPELRDRLSALLERNPELAERRTEPLELIADLPMPEGSQLRRLLELAETSYNTGETEAAQTYATELLAAAPGQEAHWAYGLAIHDGNTILGTIALDRGDTDGAARYLVAAGESPGAPTLDAGGPDLTLAERLLQSARSEEVAVYLRGVSKFWAEPCLEHLITDVEAGESGAMASFDACVHASIYGGPDPQDAP